MATYIIVCVMSIIAGYLLGFCDRKRKRPPNCGHLVQAFEDGQEYFFMEIDKGMKQYVVPGKDICFTVREITE